VDFLVSAVVFTRACFALHYSGINAPGGGTIIIDNLCGWNLWIWEFCDS